MGAEIFNEMSEGLQKGRTKVVTELIQRAIEEGIPATDILEQGLLSGMGIIGEKFKNNQVFIPEVMMAARTMNAGAALLKPLLVQEGVQSKGKVCIGTVKGDQHDIGKNLVKMMMEGAGLTVIDLGTNVPPEKFVDTAVAESCDVIACSALLTTTMPMMKAVVERAAAAGIRDRVKIIVGGAPVTQEFSDQIGADGYSADAASAAELAVTFCSCKQ